VSFDRLIPTRDDGTNGLASSVRGPRGLQDSGLPLYAGCASTALRCRRS